MHHCVIFELINYLFTCCFAKINNNQLDGYGGAEEAAAMDVEAEGERGGRGEGGQ